MLFNSFVFLFLFLPSVLAVWWLPVLPVRVRLCVLVIASYLFYGWWDYRFVSLLVVSTLVDYYVGKRLFLAQSSWRRTAWLAVSVAVNLAVLGFFKYAGFFARTANAMVGLSEGGPVPVLDFILPVGISFYTFQTMSYSIDIYRNESRPATSLLHFAAYVSMFPQLVAGPIVRYSHIEDQLREIATRIDWSVMARGLFFLGIGLGQKILLADPIAAQIDPLLADYHSLAFWGAWYAMLGYTCQLYFDFSGYSTMAVGLGMMLGFLFPQNFNSPYKAANIADFWRRWHITLSEWLRDYLFIPLGGSRNGQLITLRNLFLVMLLGGLWHGAAWTFVVWGLYHGLLLVVHALFRSWNKIQIPHAAAVAVTFTAVVFGWAIFRANSLEMAGYLMSAMLGFVGFESQPLSAMGGFEAAGMLILLLAVVFFAPNVWEIEFRPTPATAAILSAVVVSCILLFSKPSPFLYFQF